MTLKLPSHAWSVMTLGMPTVPAIENPDPNGKLELLKIPVLAESKKSKR